MLKISLEAQTDQETTLRIEGRLQGPWITELQRACTPFLGDGHLALDLEEVSFIDEAGLKLLASFRAVGVKLLNPSPFVEQLLSNCSQKPRYRFKYPWDEQDV